MVDSLEYRTPFGLYRGKRLQNGYWAVGYRWSQATAAIPSAASADHTLIEKLKHLDAPCVAKVQALDASARQMMFSLPQVSDLEPLSQLSTPPDRLQVIALLRQLAEALQILHKASLAVVDFSPQLVFLRPGSLAPVLIPGSLIPQAESGSPLVAEMPFVAPEGFRSPAASAEPVAADIYGLGALAWYLLTGTHRKQYSTTLPGEYDSTLGAFDSFIDGCCRTHPQRRFSTVAEAIGALPSESQISGSGEDLRQETASGEMLAERGSLAAIWMDRAVAAVRTPLQQAYLKYRIRLWLLSIVAAIAMVAVFVRRHELAETFPQLMQPVVGYRRGFGETIVRYVDRSYQRSEWRVLDDLEDLRKEHELPAGRYVTIKGWNSNTFYIAENYHNGRVIIYRQKDGRWNLFARSDESEKNKEFCALRVLDGDSVLAAIGNNFYRFTPGVTENLGNFQVESRYYWYVNDVTVLDDEHAVVHLGARGGVNVWRGAGIEPVDKNDQQEYRIFGDDGKAVETGSVSTIGFTRTPFRFRAAGIAQQDGNRTVVEYRNGKWHSLADIPRYGGYGRFSRINSSWLMMRGNSPGRLFLATDTGRVMGYDFSGRIIESTVSPAAAKTSGNLILVWGVDEQKYWAMDDSGTVWEFSSGVWRDVVRGMYADDVRFTWAWVSPTGTIVAITDKKIYQLQ
jgi:hypothetical protein